MNLKLDLRIFIFYVVIGLLPFIILSAISLSEYSGLVSSVTEQKVYSLLERAKSRTEFRVKSIDQDLSRLAEQDDIKRAFSQYLTSPRIFSLQEKLEHRRTDSKFFTRISLYTKNGLIIADTANKHGINTNISTPFENNSKKAHWANASKSVFIHKIFDFQNEDKLVGYVAGYLDTSLLTEYFRKTEFPADSIRKITSGDLVIYMNSDMAYNPARIKEFIFGVDMLNWKMNLVIPKNILFKEVNQMRRNNLLYTLIAIFAAAAAAYFISRRLTVPINQIVEGTKEFASGNLEYRLNMDTGYEIKKLADAFDSMANDLLERQKELAQANKLASLGTMSAGIAHEIKNPLAGLKTSTQTIKMMTDNSTLQNIAGNLELEVDRLNKIVTDMLDFAKPKNTMKERLQLCEIMEKTLSLVNNEIKKKNIEVIVSDCPIEIYADKNQMMQVFINLLLNAASAIEHDHGKITISAEKNGRFNSYADSG